MFVVVVVVVIVVAWRAPHVHHTASPPHVHHTAHHTASPPVPAAACLRSARGKMFNN